MQTIINKLSMFIIPVSEMPRAKEFYAEKLGLEITKDYRQSDDAWWVSVTPGGGITMTLTTYHDPRVKPGTMTLYFITSDINEAHKELEGKSVKVNDIKDDLYGPGSGVKWFNLEDPDGNIVFLSEK
jgi:catechol 2,3-dioxygenase-like lactoylglutathione lyase family enzyme